MFIEQFHYSLSLPLMAAVLDNNADSLFLAGNHSLVPQLSCCWIK